MTRTSRLAVGFAFATGLILLLPLVAMQFTEEVQWTAFDFVVASVLLFGAGMTYVLVSGMGSSAAYRVATGVAVASGLFLVWVNLAVGLIGSEGNPANLMYLGVLAIGVVGALITRFRPDGMAGTLLAMALAQAVIAAIAIVGGLGLPENGPAEILGINGLFIALFLASSFLYWRAARRTA
jgi:hypothetical protein